MARPRRLLLGLATIALLCLPVASATAAPANTATARLVTPSEAAAIELAHRYAPIAMLREQQDPPCETSAEQYQPTSVGAVLGNPTVTLTHDDLQTGQLEKLEKAPTAADIAGL